MDPTQAPEPEQPAPASEPVVQWQPSANEGRYAPGPGTGELFNNRPAGSLKLMDAITTGFTMLTKPTFIGPVLLLGLIVNVLIGLVFTPVLGTLTPAASASDLPSFDTGAAIGAIFGSLTLAILGGVVLNLYGQIWEAAASSGPLPTVNQVLDLLKARWISIIGTGLVVAAILIGLLVAVMIVVGILFATI